MTSAASLSVPHYKQEFPYSCVAACVRMVLAHFGNLRRALSPNGGFQATGGGQFVGQVCVCAPAMQSIKSFPSNGLGRIHRCAAPKDTIQYCPLPNEPGEKESSACSYCRPPCSTGNCAGPIASSTCSSWPRTASLQWYSPWRRSCRS